MGLVPGENLLISVSFIVISADVLEFVKDGEITICAKCSCLMADPVPKFSVAAAYCGPVMSPKLELVICSAEPDIKSFTVITLDIKTPLIGHQIATLILSYLHPVNSYQAALRQSHLNFAYQSI